MEVKIKYKKNGLLKVFKLPDIGEKYSIKKNDFNKF